MKSTLYLFLLLSVMAVSPLMAGPSDQPQRTATVAAKLLEQAKQEFLKSNFDRVIVISEKLIETGSIEQQQQAMELAGLARERQYKFAQAIAIYAEFLELYPDSEMAPKISNRLAGLKTMRLEPKQRMVKAKERREKNDWSLFGGLSQFYRDDTLDPQDGTSQRLSSSLVTDVNLFARKKSQSETLVVRVDAGMVNDFLDDDADSRISRAMLSYSNDDAGYQVIGGRQSRTAKGVSGRFDGVVFNGLSEATFNVSLFAGYPVQSSSDSIENDHRFIGSSVDFEPFKDAQLHVYLLQQEVSGLIDRQLLGTELQYRNDKGFLYGILDYDIFYQKINTVSAIANYRYDDMLALNLSYSYGNFPLLSTSNALQGQPATSMAALRALFSDKEIYQLAADRTRQSQNLFLGSSYQIDAQHQLYLSLSLSSLQATEASGNVASIEASESLYLSADYSIRGFFTPDDYTSFGSRWSESTHSEILSLIARTGFSRSRKLKFDPRIRLDYRHSKDSDVVQWIVKPSLKLTYKSSRDLSLEASLGMEYSDFDLPELSDHVVYNFFLGYVYQF